MTTTVYVNDVLRGELEPYHLWNPVPTPKVRGSGKENARRTWCLDQHTGRNEKFYVRVPQVDTGLSALQKTVRASLCGKKQPCNLFSTLSLTRAYRAPQKPGLVLVWCWSGVGLVLVWCWLVCDPFVKSSLSPLRSFFCWENIGETRYRRKTHHEARVTHHGAL